jgi:hypothetical protein
MPVQTVTKGQWREFLDTFNRVHRGWLMTVSSAGRELMHDVPLGSIVFDKDEIVIEAAMDRQHTDHVVSNPAALRIERTPEGADQMLEILGSGGELVRVRFRSAVRSELVDGVADFAKKA